MNHTQEFLCVGFPMGTLKVGLNSFLAVVCVYSQFHAAALHAFLDIVLETWSSSEYVKHSLLSRHKCKTRPSHILDLFLTSSFQTPQPCSFSPFPISRLPLRLSNPLLQTLLSSEASRPIYLTTIIQLEDVECSLPRRLPDLPRRN